MVEPSALPLLAAAMIIVITTSFIRLLAILPWASIPHKDPRLQGSKTRPSHMVIVMGSGGHSGEMASLIRDINPKRYIHRSYIMSSGDDISAAKAEQVEKTIQLRHCGRSEPTQPGETDHQTGTWDIRVVPRAREIHQPLYSTPFSSLWCLFRCLLSLKEISRTSKAAPFEYPDVIITNGPATAVMIILASMLLKFFGIAPVWKMKAIYVESFARIHTLSLSGKILLWIRVCDVFLVQWEGLANKINGNTARRKVEYEGFLV